LTVDVPDGDPYRPAAFNVVSPSNTKPEYVGGTDQITEPSNHVFFIV
tara:strand:+ start:404 stop:544 length:141 start_codon:yes stop_codon:yes gene_type:complete